MINSIKVSPRKYFSTTHSLQTSPEKRVTQNENPSNSGRNSSGFKASSPYIPKAFQSSPSLTLFDQIRSTLKSKAVCGELSGQTTQRTEAKCVDSKRKLFAFNERPGSHRHKRNNTMPEGSLAIVSTKILHQPYFRQ